MEHREFILQLKLHSEYLYTTARKYTKNSYDAEDLFQETMVKAIRFLDKYQNELNFLNWISIIMRNTFINEYRRNKMSRKFSDDLDDSVTEVLTRSISCLSNGERKFILNDIQRALATLPAIQRVAFTRYFEGYKYREIAKELNIPLGTVKRRIFSARQSLQDYLEIYCYHQNG